MSLKRLSMAAVLILLPALTGGCTSAPQEKENVSLKAIVSRADEFRNQIAAPFESANPGIQLEVIELPNDKMMDRDYVQSVMEREAPDLMQLDYFVFAGMAPAGKLASLEDFLPAREAEQSRLHPPLLEAVRQYGKGELYGLPVAFSNNIIFYNRTLLDETGASYPADGMSWGQLMELSANILPQDKQQRKVWGFYAPDWLAFTLPIKIAFSEELRWIDPAKRQVTLDTETWRELAGMVKEALDLKRIYDKPAAVTEFKDHEGNVTGSGVTPEDMYAPFLKGQVAMTLGSPVLWELLEKERPAFEWGTAAAPADSATGKKTAYLQAGLLNAIPAGSPHAEEAKQLLTFMYNDANQARAAESVGMLPLNPALQKDDRALAFYRQQPAAAGFYEIQPDIPPELTEAFIRAFEQAWTAIAADKKTVEQAFADMQAELQLAADEKLPAEAE